jgi:SAM-dependent methyltransferase
VTEGGRDREWFREWFGEEYLAVYPHRDEEEAAEAVRLFLATAGASARRGRVLDVACGEGRHLRELLAAGVAAVGLDLSSPLLNRARKADPKSRLVRGDMRRLPVAAGSFAGLTSFFTSFGYFADRDEDREVAAEYRRVLAPGGRFMLDFLNAGRVRRELVPRDERTLRGHRVTQERRVDDDTVWKRITIEDVCG